MAYLYGWAINHGPQPSPPAAWPWLTRHISADSTVALVSSGFYTMKPDWLDIEY